MTVENLLEKSRKAAESQLSEYYLDVCDGDKVRALIFIEDEKEDGNYDRELKHFIFQNIMDTIKVIKKTNLISESEKELIIEKIHQSEEYVSVRKKISKLFANHFVRCSQVYLK